MAENDYPNTQKLLDTLFFAMRVAEVIRDTTRVPDSTELFTSIKTRVREAQFTEGQLGLLLPGALDNEENPLTQALIHPLVDGLMKSPDSSAARRHLMTSELGRNPHNAGEIARHKQGIIQNAVATIQGIRSNAEIYRLIFAMEQEKVPEPVCSGLQPPLNKQKAVEIAEDIKSWTLPQLLALLEDKVIPAIEADIPAAATELGVTEDFRGRDLIHYGGGIDAFKIVAPAAWRAATVNARAGNGDHSKIGKHGDGGFGSP